jgi:hypothetical protein
MRFQIDFFEPPIIPKFVRTELRDRFVHPKLIEASLSQPDEMRLCWPLVQAGPNDVEWAPPPQEYHPDDWEDFVTKRFKEDERNMTSTRRGVRMPVATSLAALKKMLTIIEDLRRHRQGPGEEQGQAMVNYLRKAISEKERQNEVWRKQVTELRDRSYRDRAAITHQSSQTGGRQASEVNKHFGDRRWKNIYLSSDCYLASFHQVPEENLCAGFGVPSEDLYWLSESLSSHHAATQFIASDEEQRMFENYLSFLQHYVVPYQKRWREREREWETENKDQKDLARLQRENEDLKFCLKRFWMRDLLRPKDPFAEPFY